MNKPIIGVSCNYRPHEGENGNFHVDRAYTEAVYESGGIPQIIPILEADDIPSLLALYDGLVFSGGGGLLPHVEKMDELPGLDEQNPIRYTFESELIKAAVKRDIPILGICRGHQMINDAHGGSVVNLQDKTHRQNEPSNEASHEIKVEPHSVLYDSVLTEKVIVNSFHSQVIDTIGKGLKATSYSHDNFIESIEGVGTNFVMGVQFHPEFMRDNVKMLNIYKQFVQAANMFRLQKTNR